MKPLWFNILNPSEMVTYDPKAGKGPRKGMGCRSCPLDDEEGEETKLLGLERLKGKGAMLWGQTPGKDEMAEGLELRGKSSQWLWKEMARVGLKRKDFDVQNVVRCRPTAREEGRIYDRDPSPKELQHCSYYNEQALSINGGAAEVHIVLGKHAAQSLLGREYKKQNPVFWSEKLTAMIFCLDDPRHLMRENTPEWRLEEFRLRLEAAAFFVHNPGRWSFMDSCDFKGLTKVESIRAFLQKARNSGNSVAVDIEEGKVDGETRVLCIGFSYERRSARTIYLDHPEVKHSPKDRKAILALLKDFLEDSSIKKVLQYGCSDDDRLRELLGIGLKGYDFDTTYAHYLRYTFLKAHGLEAIASAHFPLYAGYKDMIAKYVKASGNYADIPKKVMTVYNGADAALTKEIEEEIGPQISLPLLKIYTQAGITLRRMEGRGPKLDAEYFKEVARLIPRRLRTIEAKLRALADDPKINLNAPAQVAAILYDKLELPDADGKRSTKESVLEIMATSTGHPFPKLLIEYRGLAKILSTYLSKYKLSADMHGGELRTRWYLTGAVTGRLRSGGTKEGIKGVINMQNLHGSPFLQNLLITDPDWRKILPFVKELEAWNPTQKAPKIPEDILDLEVFLALDYSQIEIRMLAECAGDPLLIQQFKAGIDIHCAVGNTLNPAWSLDFIKKDKPTRTFIKNCHFGMVYGLDAEGLFYYLKAKNVKTTPKKVKKFHSAYFAKYSKVAEYIVNQRAFAVEHGYVETLFGFRRLVGQGADEDRTTNPENQAVNSPIQGSAHTLLLAAMALLSAKPKLYKLLQAPLMEVHDALVFKVKLRDLPAAFESAKRLLEKDAPAYIAKLFGIELQVPLLAEASAGLRYGTMVETDVTNLPKFLKEWAEKNAKVEKSVDEEYRQAA